MAQNDLTEDKAILFGAGMVTVGVFGKAALTTKGVGVVVATKAGVPAGGFICPPAAIHIGLACVGAELINHLGRRNWWRSLSSGQSIYSRIPYICRVESGMIKKFYAIICGFLKKGKSKI